MRENTPGAIPQPVPQLPGNKVPVKSIILLTIGVIVVMALVGIGGYALGRNSVKPQLITKITPIPTEPPKICPSPASVENQKCSCPVPTVSEQSPTITPSISYPPIQCTPPVCPETGDSATRYKCGNPNGCPGGCGTVCGNQ